ncbi:hypothetical protein OAA19_01035 [Rubripirellula sp.]|nr:hypothetical protein [Rubripirellula sp.]MDB4338671.1 hypothetical protein [Rubripirellula sp.]
MTASWNTWADDEAVHREGGCHSRRNASFASQVSRKNYFLDGRESLKKLVQSGRPCLFVV